MKNSNSKRDFLQSLQEAASDLSGISEEKILKTVREYRSGQKLPKNVAVGRSKKKTGPEESLTPSILVAGIAGRAKKTTNHFPRNSFSFLTISQMGFWSDLIAIRSTKDRLYSARSSCVMSCQIGNITFLPSRSFANSPFNSCSVQRFFLRKAFENTTIPYFEFMRPLSMERRRSSPQDIKS